MVVIFCFYYKYLVLFIIGKIFYSTRFNASNLMVSW